MKILQKYLERTPERAKALMGGASRLKDLLKPHGKTALTTLAGLGAGILGSGLLEEEAEEDEEDEDEEMKKKHSRIAKLLLNHEEDEE